MSVIDKLGITTGKWIVDHGYSFPGVNVITKNNEWICEVGKAKNTGVENDSRLIAAAPEMLDALIGWCLYWDEHFEPSKRFEHSIFIVEKATGKTWEEIKELL